MARNDSVLYSGARTSPVERRKQEAKEKQEKRSRLLPSAELVLEALEKERETTKLDILKMVTIATDKEMIKETIAALNLYDQSMIKLANKFKNILRDAREPEDEDDE